MSINAKIQFEKPLHCSCVFKRNQISAARRRLEKKEATLIAQTASGWTPLINILILLCIPCIIQCVSSLVHRLVKVGMSVQLVKMTVYPDDDVNVDDQQYDDTSSGSYSERC